MSAPDSSADASRPDDGLPDDLAQVGVYGTTQEGFDHGLVILAQGYACWLMPSDAGYRLLVESSAATRARAELASYDRESAGWPPPGATEAPGRTRLELATPLLWALAVLLVFQGQLRHPEWTDASLLDTTAVFGRGEWWRAFSALFLHANETHLLSNLIGGLFVFAAVVSLLGRGRGWLLIGLAGVGGNLAIAAAYFPGPYRSLGASTAIFGALGLLTGRAARVAAGARRPHGWRSFFVPLAAGMVVLALHGAGGPPVDVLAHGMGFIAGTIMGFLARRTTTIVRE